MIDVLLWIFFGAIIGWFSWLLPKNEFNNRLTLKLITGTIGGLVGGILTGILIYPVNAEGFSSFSLVGAMLVSIIFTVLLTRHATPSRS